MCTAVPWRTYIQVYIYINLYTVLCTTDWSGLTPKVSVVHATRDIDASSVEGWCAQYGRPTGVVVCGTVNPDVQLMLAKHLSPILRTTTPAARRFWFGVTRNDGRFGQTGRCDPFAQPDGATHGLCKTLALEWPEVFCRAVDVHDDLDAATMVRLVHAELRDPDRRWSEIGYPSADERRVFVRVSLDEASAPKLHDGMTFVVSGGAKGITPRCLQALVERIKGGTFHLLGRSDAHVPEWSVGVEDADLKARCKAHLKATGAFNPAAHRSAVRSAQSAREIEANLAALRAAGADEVHYHQCDLNDGDAVKALLGTFGRVDALVHASGVLRDKAVENKTIEGLRWYQRPQNRGQQP